MTQDAREGGFKATGAETDTAGPVDSNGLSSGPESYAGVIRGAGDAESAGYVNDLRASIRVLEHVIDMRNATIERLWAQLNEATNVPHERPGAAGPCLNSCDGQSAVWSTSDHLWRCTTCARIVGAKP